MKVTLHDSCFLAKHNGIVRQLRDILYSIPGLKLEEMDHHGLKSICCGGGGGGVFMDAKKGERLSEIRIKEALKTETDFMITACPICAAMFDDTVKSMEEVNLQILDIFELISQVV